MSVEYSSCVFYGVELDISTEDFYEIYDHKLIHGGKVSIEMMGDHMCGKSVPMAFITSSKIEGGNQAHWFGVKCLNVDKQRDYGYLTEILDKLNEAGIKWRGSFGWFFANEVS